MDKQHDGNGSCIIIESILVQFSLSRRDKRKGNHNKRYYLT